MPDRIDPGPGWRLLEKGETKPHGYEVRWLGAWHAGGDAGGIVDSSTLPCRARNLITTKSIATRATMRTAYDGGTTITRTMRNDEGLSLQEMSDVSSVFLKQVRGCHTIAKFAYIMLEIHREGEP